MCIQAHMGRKGVQLSVVLHTKYKCLLKIVPSAIKGSPDWTLLISCYIYTHHRVIGLLILYTNTAVIYDM